MTFRIILTCLSCLAYLGCAALPFCLVAGVFGGSPGYLEMCGLAWLWIILLVTGMCTGPTGSNTQH